MPNNNLTDAEIKKALECYIHKVKEKCELCDYKNSEVCDICICNNFKTTLDLINRQEEQIATQQAEIERLNKEVDRLSQCVLYKNAELDEYEKIKTTIDEFWEILLTLSLFKRKEKPTLEEFAEAIQEIKAEAYKEFANWQEIKLANNPNISTVALQSIIKTNDNLLKELVGENNADK